MLLKLPVCDIFQSSCQGSGPCWAWDPEPCLHHQCSRQLWDDEHDLPLHLCHEWSLSLACDVHGRCGDLSLGDSETTYFMNNINMNCRVGLFVQQDLLVNTFLRPVARQQQKLFCEKYSNVGRNGSNHLHKLIANIEREKLSGDSGDIQSFTMRLSKWKHLCNVVSYMILIHQFHQKCWWCSV